MNISFGAKRVLDVETKSIEAAKSRTSQEIGQKKFLDKIPDEYKTGNSVHWSEYRHLLTNEQTQNLPKMQRDLKSLYKKEDYEGIFDYLGIKTKTNEDGALTISEYKQPDKNVTFEMFGIDENKLFENVAEIEGDADFLNSNLNSLHNLVKIKGNARFSTSKIESLSNLKEVEGNLNFEHSNVKDLGSLEYVGGGANFKNSKIQSLKNLKHIGKNALFAFSKVRDVSSLEYVGGKISINNSLLTKHDFKGVQRPEK